MHRPRRLTEEEIEYVVSHIESIPSVSAHVSEVALDNLKRETRKRLARIELSMSEDAIDKVIAHINQTTSAARIREGYPAGPNGSSSISYSGTQSTFKTHQGISGTSAKIETGIRELRTLVTIQKETPSKRMIVHFNERVTRDDVIDMRSLMVQLTLKDIITSTVIGELGVGSMKREWWHDIDQFSVRRDGETFMRIYLSGVVLYEHRVTPTRAKKALEMSLAEGDIDYFVLVASPFVTNYKSHPYEYGYIDAFVKPSHVKSDESRETRSVLTQTLERYFEGTSIKGIRGIEELHPVVVRPESLFKKERVPTVEEREVFDLSERRHYVVDIDFKRISEFGSMSPYFMQKALEEAGLEVVETTRSMDSWKKLKKGRIEGFVIRKRDVEEGKNVPEMVSAASSEYVYALTIGSNIKEMSMFSFVDASRLMTNIPVTMTEYFGVEVAFSYHCQMLTNTMKYIQAATVNMRHVYLLLDWIFQTGEPFGINARGNKKKGADFLSQSAVGSPATTMFNAAIGRKKTTVDSPITAIMIGSPSPFTSREEKIQKVESDIYKEKIMAEAKEKRKAREDRRKGNAGGLLSTMATVAELEQEIDDFIDSGASWDQLSVLEIIRSEYGRDSVVTGSRVVSQDKDNVQLSPTEWVDLTKYVSKKPPSTSLTMSLPEIAQGEEEEEEAESYVILDRVRTRSTVQGEKGRDFDKDYMIRSNTLRRYIPDESGEYQRKRRGRGYRDSAWLSSKKILDAMSTLQVN